MGRLIRVKKAGGPATDAVAYIVAISDPQTAIDLIRRGATDSNVEIEDLGKVSDALLLAMKLQPGQYMRADEFQRHGNHLG
jgi:hypothetical protein